MCLALTRARGIVAQCEVRSREAVDWQGGAGRCERSPARVDALGPPAPHLDRRVTMGTRFEQASCLRL